MFLRKTDMKKNMRLVAKAAGMMSVVKKSATTPTTTTKTTKTTV